VSDSGHIVYLYNKNAEAEKMANNKEIQNKLTKNLLDLIILQIIEEHPMHGYELMITIRKNFGVCFGASTIYPLLNTMEKKQYLKYFWDMDSERPRKIYELTSDGKAMLEYTSGALGVICKTFGKNSNLKDTEARREIEFNVAINLKRD
jgi:DNA-binding PadR family transcriptional regulator